MSNRQFASQAVVVLLS